MRTDKTVLVKGLQLIAYTIALMFTAPAVLFQAFKNQEHPWFWVVFITGILLAIAAISLGFYGMKVIMDSLFGKKQKS
ncbi:MAG: hypothetical protein COC08_05355 [Maribacter sp.]|nr:MAG: hypothetical protein COC08_05355 [Maribacter sp.]